MGFPKTCTKAYEATVNDCTFSELSLLGGTGCSANCEIALEAAEDFVQRSCASLSAPGDSLIGQIFVGNLISFLCTPTSSPTTTTMTTAAASPSTSISMASDTATKTSTAAASGSARSASSTVASASSSATESSSSSSTSISSSSQTTTLTTSFTSTSTSSAGITSASSATQAYRGNNGNSGDSGGGSPFDGAGVLNMPQQQHMLFLCLIALFFGLR
ncbi:hypothetical protein LTS17_001975 [Exophiala oligosperma]